MSETKTSWTQKITDCLTEILREQAGSSNPVVDYELVSDPSGGPDDMQVWFICRTNGERNDFISTERSRSISVFKKKMIAAGFPDSAVASVEIRVTSREEVEKAGGGSRFFR